MALATRPKPSVNHKKRKAQHHRQGKPYLKAYWPYLPIALIIAGGLFINSNWPKPSVLGATSDYSTNVLLSATNQARAQHNESALTIDSRLMAASQAKANDMASHNYWSHNTPDGKTPWAFITNAGYQYQTAGENLAYGFNNASDTVKGWMNSSEHRANILNNTYQNVGFGVAQSPNFQGHGPETIVVAEYAQPVGGGISISFSVPNSSTNTAPADVKGASTEIAPQNVSRIQVLTGGHAQWIGLAATIVMLAALGIFIARHGYRVRRALSRGEAFVAHHPYLDIAIVFIFMAGYVVTRTSGFIR